MATEKSKRVVTFDVSEDLTEIVFNVAGAGKTKVTIANLSEQASQMATIFGVVRKVTNAAALDAGSTNDQKFAAIKAMAENLDKGGEWNIGRTAGSGKGRTEGLVVLAISRVYDETVEKAEATITRTMEKKGMDRKAALKLWSGTDKVAAMIATIQAERATARAKAANIDTDALMDELSD